MATTYGDVNRERDAMVEKLGDVLKELRDLAEGKLTKGKAEQLRKAIADVEDVAAELEADAEQAHRDWLAAPLAQTGAIDVMTRHRRQGRTDGVAGPRDLMAALKESLAQARAAWTEPGT